MGWFTPTPTKNFYTPNHLIFRFPRFCIIQPSLVYDSPHRPPYPPLLLGFVGPFLLPTNTHSWGANSFGLWPVDRNLQGCPRRRYYMSVVLCPFFERPHRKNSFTPLTEPVRPGAWPFIVSPQKTTHPGTPLGGLFEVFGGYYGEGVDLLLYPPLSPPAARRGFRFPALSVLISSLSRTLCVYYALARGVWVLNPFFPPTTPVKFCLVPAPSPRGYRFCLHNVTFPACRFTR